MEYKYRSMLLEKHREAARYFKFKGYEDYYKRERAIVRLLEKQIDAIEKKD